MQHPNLAILCQHLVSLPGVAYVVLSLLVEGVEDLGDPPTGPLLGRRLKRLSEEPPLTLLVISLKRFGLNWSP